jgi:ATP-binding cassette subfamily B protein
VVLAEGQVVEQGSHDELMGAAPSYRTLLSGLEEDGAEKVGDRIEALAGASRGQRDDGIGLARRRCRCRHWPWPVSRSIGAPSIGPGLGGGGAVAAVPGD